MTEGSVPNKDFLFLYTTEDFHLPSFVLGRTDVSSTAMLSFIPKFCQLKVDDAYKAAMGGTPIESDIESARGEYIFLLDRSGSMEGQRISQATAALTLFIRSLPTDSFFNVVSFGGDYKKLFDESEKYSNTTVVAAIDKVKKMGADMGGTEIYAPLLQVLTQKPIDGYPKQVFLLTDGGVSDTANVLRMIATNTKYARLHFIGIGNGASANLIVEGAVKGKGSHIFISDNENPA